MQRQLPAAERSASFARRIDAADEEFDYWRVTSMPNGLRDRTNDLFHALSKKDENGQIRSDTTRRAEAVFIRISCMFVGNHVSKNPQALDLNFNRVACLHPQRRRSLASNTARSACGNHVAALQARKR